MTEAQKRVIEAVKAWQIEVETSNCQDDLWDSERRLLKSLDELISSDEQATDVCECGHQKSSHVNGGFCNGLATEDDYKRYGLRACYCGGFVPKQKGGE